MKRVALFWVMTVLSVMRMFGYDIEVREEYSLWSQTFCYNITGEGEVELAKYSAYASKYYNIPSDVTIPGEITYEDKTYQVVSLGNEAFKENTYLRSVYLPYTIARIGDGCFLSAKELGRVRVISTNGTNSITYIGNNAFKNCLALYDTNVIGESVTYIGTSAFEFCCDLLSVRIPNSVTSLGYRAFSDCRRLKSASIGTGVSKIPPECFSGCIVMTSVSIASGVKTIMQNAFEGTAISSVRIPDTTTEIYREAFRNCQQLKSVTLSNSLTTLSESLFAGCINLTEVVIPASVRKIELSAFYGCTNLSKVDFSSATSLQEIATGAFFGARLSNVTLPNSVQTIGQGCFQNCTSILSLTLGNSVATIGDIAFSNCNSLRQIFAYPVTPPNISFTTFSAANYDNVTLKVPIEAVASYSAHEVWGLFRNIVGVEGAGLENALVDGKEVVAVYSISGRPVDKRLDLLPQGIYLVKYSDGSTAKIFVKPVG